MTYRHRLSRLYVSLHHVDLLLHDLVALHLQLPPPLQVAAQQLFGIQTVIWGVKMPRGDARTVVRAASVAGRAICRERREEGAVSASWLITHTSTCQG